MVPGWVWKIKKFCSKIATREFKLFNKLLNHPSPPKDKKIYITLQYPKYCSFNLATDNWKNGKAKLFFFWMLSSFLSFSLHEIINIYETFGSWKYCSTQDWFSFSLIFLSNFNYHYLISCSIFFIGCINSCEFALTILTEILYIFRLEISTKTASKINKHRFVSRGYFCFHFHRL